MKCNNCGYENPSGQYKCQKCGNSLLPAIPKETYSEAKTRLPRWMTSNLWLVLIVCMAGVIMITSLAIVLFFAYRTTSNIITSQASTAKIAENIEAAPMDPAPDMAEKEVEDATTDGLNESSGANSGDYFVTYDSSIGEYVKGDQLQLPNSDILIGLPEHVSAWSSMQDGTLVFNFELRQNQEFILRVACRETVYPFTLTEEQEYFSSDNNYMRLEGTDRQFYYIQEDVPNHFLATVVDLDAGYNYYISLEPFLQYDNEQDQQAQSRRAFAILNNEVFANSSLKAEEKTQ